MKPIWSTFCRLLVIVLMASAGSSVAQTGEDYEVYDAVVRHMFRDNTTRFDMNAKIDQIIFRDRTFSRYARGEDREDWQHARQFMSSLSDETIAGYESVRKTEADLESKLDVTLKYSFISESRLATVFDRNQLSTGSTDQWNEFYKLYPKSGGVNSFSRVGFDKARRNALVYFVNWCGSLCGTGTYIHLQKSSDGWEVKESAMMWIS